MTHKSDKTLYLLFSFLREKKGQKIPIFISLAYDEKFSHNQVTDLVESLFKLEDDGADFDTLAKNNILVYLYEHNKEKFTSIYESIKKMEDSLSEEYYENNPKRVRLIGRILFAICKIVLGKKDLSFLQEIRKDRPHVFKDVVKYKYQFRGSLLEDVADFKLFEMCYNFIHLFTVQKAFLNIIYILIRNNEYDNPTLTYIIDEANLGKIKARGAIYYALKTLAKQRHWDFVFSLINKLDSLENLPLDLSDIDLYPIDLFEYFCRYERYDLFEKVLKMNKLGKDAVLKMKSDFGNFLPEAEKIIDKYLKEQ